MESIGSNVSIFTWHGCTFRVFGSPHWAYIPKETPLIGYANIHSALEHLRRRAERKGSKGPTVMLVGPSDEAKSTLCKVLLNYAARRGRRPIFADLDLARGHLSIPGSIGAALVTQPADIDEGFDQHGLVAFHFGHQWPGDNIELYDRLTRKLARVVRSQVSHSGVIVNFGEWVRISETDIVKLRPVHMVVRETVCF